LDVLLRLTQPLPQRFKPLLQVVMHSATTHVTCALWMLVVQTLPQPPQLSGSCVMSMHPPSQDSMPSAHPESAGASRATSAAPPASAAGPSSEDSATTAGPSGTAVSAGASTLDAPSLGVVESGPLQSLQSRDENDDRPLISLQAAVVRSSPPAARTRALLTPFRLHLRGRTRPAESNPHPRHV
jgi:hypothetical protein